MTMYVELATNEPIIRTGADSVTLLGMEDILVPPWLVPYRDDLGAIVVLRGQKTHPSRNGRRALSLGAPLSANEPPGSQLDEIVPAQSLALGYRDVVSSPTVRASLKGGHHKGFAVRPRRCGLPAGDHSRDGRM